MPENDLDPPCHPDANAERDDSPRCYSTDAAASEGLLPRFDGVDAPASALGDPLFALHRNAWSHWGYCGVPNQRKPVPAIRPCNPWWPSETVAQVCGEASVCYQSQLVEPEDCVLVDGTWRAVAGTDMAAPEDWIVDEPGTRQDPELRGCTNYATVAGKVDRARLLDCVRQLTAADQRGICIVGLDPPPQTNPPTGTSSDVCRARNR